MAAVVRTNVARQRRTAILFDPKFVTARSSSG